MQEEGRQKEEGSEEWERKESRCDRATPSTHVAFAVADHTRCQGGTRPVQRPLLHYFSKFTQSSAQGGKTLPPFQEEEMETTWGLCLRPHKQGEDCKAFALLSSSAFYSKTSLPPSFLFLSPRIKSCQEGS